MKFFRIFVPLLIIPSLVYGGKLIFSPEKGFVANLPTWTSPEKKFSILMVLPGYSVKAKNEINNWKFKAEKNGFLLICMDVDYDQIQLNSDMEDLCSRMIGVCNDFIAQGQPIDLQRIYIAGTSMGATTAINLALRYPKQFRAVADVSGGRLMRGSEFFIQNAAGQNFYLAHGKKR